MTPSERSALLATLVVLFMNALVFAVGYLWGYGNGMNAAWKKARECVYNLGPFAEIDRVLHAIDQKRETL